MSLSFAEFLQSCLTDERLRRFEEILKFRTRHFTVVLENIFHAHNASACLRTCDCFGVQDVHVIECQNKFDPNPDISLGASKWLTLETYHTTQESDHEAPDGKATTECLRRLKKNGYRLLATSPRQDSLPISEIDYEERTAIIFGAEQLGVSETAIIEADATVHIPMYGFTESFNISVSVAIILNQLTSQLHASNIKWQLTAEEREALHHNWVCQSLGSKLEPLQRRYDAEHQ